jgi:beta-phosphoglucomutase-like phosphatase (HAD superfamily)
VFAGEMVAAKKPDPAIYNLASEQLGLDPSQCLVVEDSQIGLGAALSAGMHCVITTSAYTENEDFTGAARVLSELGDGDRVQVSLAQCQVLVRDGV